VTIHFSQIVIIISQINHHHKLLTESQIHDELLHVFLQFQRWSHYVSVLVLKS